MNENWTKEDGGELVVYDSNALEISRVYPEEGTFVVFLSEEFPHEVLPTFRDRYSIAGWFRR